MGNSRKISNESYNITFLNYRTLYKKNSILMSGSQLGVVRSTSLQTVEICSSMVKKKPIDKSYDSAAILDCLQTQST